MESPLCEQRITKVSLAEILRCLEHPISEEQAWAVCFQCCCKMEQLARGLYPPLQSVFVKGLGSIFIHADGTASFKVYHNSDVGSIQQSEDKLLEYLGVLIYEALDWGIDSQAERELSDPLEKLLCLMLKLDDEAMKPAVTLQDVIKSLRKMDVEDLVEYPLQKKEKHWASLWPNIIRELQNGVRLHKATERPQPQVPSKESICSPYELLLDDIQHKRYTLRKICFSCHKQIFLKWPYSCYLCSSVVCCDCCIKMSMPFRMCVHLPLHFLKLLRLSREEDSAIQEQKNLELLHEIEHWEWFGVPVILEPHCLAQPLCCYTKTMADWLTADICTQCEQYLLNMASSQQQSISLRRISWP
ncbi:PREDICTED: protein spire homolog 1-like [Chaetura pelagica]|uniref:protein spire homolog 1-like n=1 Tax=Chaetura pelagica TaxID=8897 RepID=UPI000523749D|nr:PREDICTED: protein spire homolog 1-like [Chaetura pelagica]